MLLFVFIFLILFNYSNCTNELDDGNIRFCSIGMGVFGKIIAKIAIEKGFKMVSAFTRYSYQTQTVGELLNITGDESLSFLVSNINTLQDVIDKTRPHFCIDATDSSLQSVYTHFVKLIQKRIHILTLVDDAVYPHSQLDLESYELFQSLHQMAQHNNVVIIGGGYSDSILIPMIPSIAASMQSLSKIHLTQKENIDDWGDFAHHSQQYGVGLTPTQFENAFTNDIDTGIGNWQRRIVESIANGINTEILKANDDDKNRLQIYTKKECFFIENENGIFSKVINKSIGFGDCAGMNTTVLAKVSNDIQIVFSVIFAVIPNIDRMNDIECSFIGAKNVEFSIRNVDGKITTGASLIHRAHSVLNELKPGFYNVARLKANKYWENISEFASELPYVYDS